MQIVWCAPFIGKSDKDMMPMEMIFDLISDRFSKYMVMLILFTACMLIFVERGEMDRKGLRKESLFCLVSGLAYVFILILGMIVGFIHG